MNAERWKSLRRCHDCLEKGNTNYLWVQKWGKTYDGKQEYRLTCDECGHAETTKWDGK